MSSSATAFTRRTLLRLRTLCCLLALALTALLPVTARAAAAPELAEAEAAIVCDSEGRELWSKNAYLELQPASITKVMTAVIALDSGMDLDRPVSVVAEPPGGNSQTAGFKVGDSTTLRDLLLATLVYSGNDAALNVAVIVGGSESAFVDRMNQKAAELGMTHTRFVNPHGLEQEGHHSCVSDLAILGRYALTRYPFIARAVQLRSVDLLIGGQAETLASTDDLMESYEGLLGIKTGAVESGQGFLGASKRSGVTLYTCVLGCESSEGRFADTAALMDWAYEDAYRWHRPTREGGILAVVPSALDLGAKRLLVAPDGFGAYAQGDDPILGSGWLASTHLLSGASEVRGAYWWRQGARLTGTTALSASNESYDVACLNVFALPLFEDAVSQRVL